MSKTQLKVLWIGIGIFVLMCLFPPMTYGYRFILERGNISLSRLCIQLAIVVAITVGFIYSLKVDPELTLKIPCFFSYLFGYHGGHRRPYAEVLEEARNKKDKTNVRLFWVVLLVLLLLALIVVGLSYEGIASWSP